MSVTETDVIDVIGTDRQSGNIILTVSDHLAWEPHHAEHARILQRKLERYLDFIVSGQLLAEYPRAADRRIGVEVMFKHPPNEEATAWLDDARAEYLKRGYELTWKTYPK